MKLSLNNTLIPTLVLAFVGVAVTFLAPIFTTTTRWLVLLVVLVYLGLKGKLLAPLRTRFGVVTLLYAFWTVCTMMWSEQPLLSGMKGIAFSMLSLTAVAAGYYWSRHRDASQAVDYLLPLTMCAIVAGLFGRFSAVALDSGPVSMYSGLVVGSNMFGSMLAMCSPYLIWQLYLNWSRRNRRLWWIAVSGIALYYLLAASSRSALLMVLCTLAGLFMALSMTKRLQMIILLVTVTTNAFVLSPGVIERIEQQWIYKSVDRTGGVLNSRRTVWEYSYNQAVKGGWFGGGYGVTIGDTTQFTGGLTAVGYGREKGNSQLAVLEETGLIGGMLYLFLLIALFQRLLKVLLAWPRSPQKTLLAVITGALAGMVVHSCFEAWWVAPGGPETAYFWVLSGIALGLASHKPAVRVAPVQQRGLRKQLQNPPVSPGSATV